MLAAIDLPPDQGRSWWLREALAADPGAPCPPLTGLHEADVVIVGGGYTGMWTAWNLLERDPGLDIVLLEQDICGGGPSGRNGGFTNGWWTNLGSLIDLFGEQEALALCEAGDESTIEIGRWCEENGVDAWYVRAGGLGVATSPAQRGERDELVETVRRLEAGGTSLEDSLALWQRGEELAAICQRWLDGARARLDRAVSTDAGGASPTPPRTS